MQLQRIKRRIERIKRELQGIGPMRPGSLSKQYNVCGNPRCRCKDQKTPRKHGPYYQLSYVHKGQSTTQFIQPRFVTEVKQQLANYKRFKALTAQWVDLALTYTKLTLQEAKQNNSK
jgi:hypothetical protein